MRNKNWEITDLPSVKGKIRENVDLSKSCWFRLGGTARFVFKPESAQDLAYFLKNKPNDLKCLPLGVGSNVIIRDQGFSGVIVRLGREFNFIKKEGENLHVGCAVLDMNLAEFALQNEIANLEFFAGIPGTVGGAVAMNAGAYGSEIKDVLLKCTAVDENGEIHELSSEELGFSYRKNNLTGNWFFTSVLIKAPQGHRETIAENIKHIQQSREKSQPIREMTGGSTFTNPPGFKAWQLIEQAGCRGLKIGGAMVSEMHCNFLINDGSATSNDMIELIETIKSRVLESTGIVLHNEIKIIG